MILVVMGPPAAGKGTQAKEISRRRQLAQLSTGEMLRGAIATGNAIGLQSKPVMAAGGLVADAIVIEVVANRINQPDCTNGFILDGFPRTLTQAQALSDLLSVRQRKLDGVIALRIDDEVLVERVTGRFTCADTACGEGYHERFKAPAAAGICDRCGGRTFVRRPDDNAEAMRARLAAYHAETAPLLGYYAAAGLLHIVDAAATIGDVAAAIDRVIAGLPVARAQGA
jgi:adenylate kinase